MSSENTMRMWNDCAEGGSVRPKLKTIIKTASYTVTPDDYGSVLTTRGALAAVTFTLPAAGSTNDGEWVLFVNVANQNMLVAGADEGLVTFNDLTADSIGFKTTNEKIGGAFLAISDGTSWVVVPLATETQTITVASGPSASVSASVSSSPSTSVSATPTSSPSGSPSTSPSASPSASPSTSPSST